MKEIANQSFEGERSLFHLQNAVVDHCEFLEGESPLKESSNLRVEECTFTWKYPFWYGRDIEVSDCHLLEMARAGMWYDRNISFSNCVLECPKGFRKCIGVSLEKCQFTNGDETLWWNENVIIKNTQIKGNYLLMGSKQIKIDGLELHGNYPFDGCEDIEISNSTLYAKDAFWNCKNVVVKNSFIEGEYFGWNSENVTLIDCEIRSHQGFCYMKNVKLIRCKIIDTDLSFEYCDNIDAEVLTKIDSIKNPRSGKIVCAGYGELIQDDPAIDRSKIEIKIHEV